MFYIVISAVLTMGALLDGWLNRRMSKLWFVVFGAVLWAVLCLRYYQGTDYYTYWELFSSVQPSFLDTLRNPPWHGEMGWHLMTVLPRKWDWPFELFMAMVGTFSMAGILWGIWKYSPYKLVSLLLMYPSLYMTYLFSGVRQGLAISLFLGVGVHLLMKRKWLLYCLFILLITSFHTASCVLIAVPIFLDAGGNRKIKFWLRLAAYCGLAVLGILGYTGLLETLADWIGVTIPYSSNGGSMAANLVRLVYFVAIYFLHRWNRSAENRVEECLYRAYFLGFVLFAATSFNALISNRMTAPLKLVEILLIPLELYLLRQKDPVHVKNRGAFGLRPDRKTLVALLLCVVVMIPNVEMYKNLGAYIDQGGYYEWVTPTSYPYLTVFQKDRVSDYRDARPIG